LAGLSTDHRAVVVLRVWLDWSEAEVASALKIPRGTVKSRLARALEQLREVLGDD
jgi:DNA-directed RNA polymerase specialized sigma24 family protein